MTTVKVLTLAMIAASACTPGIDRNKMVEGNAEATPDKQIAQPCKPGDNPEDCEVVLSKFPKPTAPAK